MALARFYRHKPLAAVGKPLELDGREGILGQQTVEHQRDSDEPFLHIALPFVSTLYLHVWREAARPALVGVDGAVLSGSIDTSEPKIIGRSTFRWLGN